MSEEQNQNSNDPSNRATAVSVFEQSNGMNDFPVLKAFQEYIEAEQARARKRMLGLSIFFVVLLVVVVVTFSVIMAAIINRDQQSLSAIATRNQELSDKLLDIALRERTQPPVTVNQTLPVPSAVPVAPSRPDNTSVLQPVLDRLEKLASSLNSPSAAQTVPSPRSNTDVSIKDTQTMADTVSTAERQQREDLRRQREAIAAERAKLKEEQEKLRLEQIEQHRRRLYPEYYAQEEARKQAEQEAKKAPAAVKEEPPAVVVPTAKAVEPKPQKPQKPQMDQKAIAAVQPVNLDTAKPVSYFDQDDDESTAQPAPAQSSHVAPETTKVAPEMKREQKTDSPSRPPETSGPEKREAPVATPQKIETISVGGSKGNDQIPWLIELP